MYQKIIIAGNLGGDPVMRFTPSGQGVTNFSVASTLPFLMKLIQFLLMKPEHL